MLTPTPAVSRAALSLRYVSLCPSGVNHWVASRTMNPKWSKATITIAPSTRLIKMSISVPINKRAQHAMRVHRRGGPAGRDKYHAVAQAERQINKSLSRGPAFSFSDGSLRLLGQKAQSGDEGRNVSTRRFGRGSFSPARMWSE